MQVEMFVFTRTHVQKGETSIMQLGNFARIRSMTSCLYDYVINNKGEKKIKERRDVGVEGTGWKWRRQNTRHRRTLEQNEKLKTK
jgi:hypothetical protein